jgi:hypothetical protein
LAWDESNNVTDQEALGALLVSGGIAIGGAFLNRDNEPPTDDGAGNAEAGLLLGGGAVIQGSIILDSGYLVDHNFPKKPGSDGELRMSSDHLYIYSKTHAQWGRVSIAYDEDVTGGTPVETSHKSLSHITSADAPTSATATGTKGDIRLDENHIYHCVATDTWKRSLLSTWS